MKLLIVLCLFAVAIASPQAREEDIHARIIRNEYSRDTISGAFKSAVELSNGVNQAMNGEPEPIEGAIVMSGYYFLPNGDGTFARVDWVSDENGFRATSPIIPQLPQFVLDQIAFAQSKRK